MMNSIKGGTNITGPKSNRTYDQHLFEKEYKVPQRYLTPVNTATPGPEGLSRGALIGAIASFIAGGVLVGLGVFYLIHYLRRRVRRKEIGTIDVSQVEDLGNDVIPCELPGPKVHKVENVRANEMASHSLAEIWIDPVELPGPAVPVREG